MIGPMGDCLCLALNAEILLWDKVFPFHWRELFVNIWIVVHPRDSPSSIASVSPLAIGICAPRSRIGLMFFFTRLLNLYSFLSIILPFLAAKYNVFC